ncbi:dihydroxyacetone kinase family protein [Trueperella sp. LYQ143]|uniref:dihydroxyacetone kinase family protein n=1 Tax=Trueperella sp. LYQ143 TaxID=3391059 RepID=UPI00398362D9
MTYLVNNPEEFAADSLRGFVAAFPEYVQPVHGGVVRASASPHGEVSVVVGGGSGHYPAFAGWVGSGIAHGSVCGNIFASPSASQVTSVVRAADNGGGTLLLFGNYAGDVLHFGNGAQQLRAEGMDVRIVPISDDIASNTPDKHDDRRGIAGDLFVVKVAGAAAAAGKSLDEVEALARKANARTRTLGVAFTGCTLPGASEPLFTVESGTFGLGLGIHGEQGISSHEMASARDIATMLVDKILAEEPARDENYAGRVGVLVNGLGATKYEELFVLYGTVAQLLEERGLTPVGPIVDEQVTSLDMAGVSLTLCFLDEELEELWLAGCDTPALRRGVVEHSQQKRVVRAEEDEEIPAGSADSAAFAEKIAEILDAFERSAREAEPMLGKIDAIAGDGDHGQGMTLGTTAAAKAARECVAASAGARTLLARAGAAWSEGAGGTSGALWGGALGRIAFGLSDQETPSREEIIAAVVAGARAIQEMGGAQIGDKTMIDAVIPFAQGLEERANSSASLADIWRAAAQEATDAAEATAEILARKGRARTHGEASIGTPDPGAISFALLMSAVPDLIAE